MYGVNVTCVVLCSVDTVNTVTKSDTKEPKCLKFRINENNYVNVLKLIMRTNDKLKEACWWGHMTIIPQIYEILP